MSRRASKRRRNFRIEALESRRLLSGTIGVLDDLVTLIQSIGTATGWYSDGDVAHTTDSSGKSDKHETKHEGDGEDNSGPTVSEPDDVEVNPVDTVEPVDSSGPGGGEDDIMIGPVEVTSPTDPFSAEPVTPIDTVTEPIDTSIDTPIDSPIDTPVETTDPIDVIVPTDEPVVTVDPAVDPIDFTDPGPTDAGGPLITDPVDLAEPVVTTDPIDTTTIDMPAEPVAQAPLETDKSDKGHGNDKGKDNNHGNNGNHGVTHNVTPPPVDQGSSDVETTAGNNSSGGSNNGSNTSNNSGGSSSETVASSQTPPTESQTTANSAQTSPPSEPAATPPAAAEQAAPGRQVAAAQQSSSASQTSTPASSTAASVLPVNAQTAQSATPAPAASAESLNVVEAGAAFGVTLADIEATDLAAQQAQDDALAAKTNPLIKVMWTFVIDQPLERVRVVRAQAAAASLAASTISVDPILKVVQELTLVTPTFALPDARVDGAEAGGAIGALNVGQAQIAAAMSDPSNTTRNIILALAAGSAVMAVQWYRLRQKKLADAAIKLAALMQFDPLAVWLDDPETREN